MLGCSFQNTLNNNAGTLNKIIVAFQMKRSAFKWPQDMEEEIRMVEVYVVVSNEEVFADHQISTSTHIIRSNRSL